MIDESNSGFGGVEYDPTTHDYYTNYAVNDAPPSTVVPQAVAEITDQQVEKMRPLHEVLDPEALDDLLDSGRDTGDDVEVAFTYAGVEVTADSSGVVVLDPVDDEG